MADMALRSQREPPPISACQGRVGVFRALYLGDMLCAIPALRALRNHCPSARITLIGLPWAREIATQFPEYIDDFLPFPGHPQLPERPATEIEYRQFVYAFPTDFEWLIQLHGDAHDSVMRPTSQALSVRRHRPRVGSIVQERALGCALRLFR